MHALSMGDSRAQNRLGLQGNPIQIPLVMDTAAQIQYRTGPYKLHPLLIVKLEKVVYYLGKKKKKAISIGNKLGKSKIIC